MTWALFATIGAAAGASHAWLLRRAVRARASPLGTLGRFFLVAAALVAAALAGQLLAAASGWAAGFGLAASWLARRWS